MLTILLVSFALLCGSQQTAQAGGTAENLLLLVNADSASSKLIANHYIRWRNVPATNVVYLSDIPDKVQINVDSFRKLILKPTIEAMQQRGITGQIDYIVYSSGFPTKIQCGEDRKKIDTKGNANANKLLKPIVAINSATYFLPTVNAGDPGYIGMANNWYYRGPASRAFNTMFVGEDQKNYQSGLDAYRQSNFQEAVDTWLELAATKPDHFLLWYQIARGYAQLGQADDTIAALRTAMEHGWDFRKTTQLDTAFAGLAQNSGFRELLAEQSLDEFKFMPTMGFRSQFAWQPNGIPLAGKQQIGPRYFLSTVLAVTSGRGNTDREALEYLKSAVEADFSNPRGTFYFTKTKDVRSRTRTGNFADAIGYLERLGHACEIVQTQLPNGKQDVLGAAIGVSNFNWQKSQSKIIPGAICENLTSFGGRLEENAGQSPLTNFLRNGAAGSSGTVVEPYAVQAKFPHPMMYVHYARGASLAESFYQSVQAPFQLLIVGDPLCRPFAKEPTFSTTGLAAGDTVQGEVEVKLQADPESDIAAYEVFVEGKYRARLNMGQSLKFDSRQLSNGRHELRLVALGKDMLETRSRQVLPFFVANESQQFDFSCDKIKPRLDSEITLTANCPGAEKIVFRHNGRAIGTLTRERGKATVQCKLIGGGPITLMAEATIDDKIIVAKPIEIEIR